MISGIASITMKFAAMCPMWPGSQLRRLTYALERHLSASTHVPLGTIDVAHGPHQPPRLARSVVARRTARGLTAVLVFLAGHPLALAEWGFVDSVDNFTDEPIQFAYYSDDEHRIQLSRLDDNSVWMYITRKKIGTFEPDRNVEYRVDQGILRGENTISFSRLKESLGDEPTYVWQPDTVAFLVWHGNPDEPRPDPCGFIGELLSGTILGVRYYISRLDRDTFSVDLADADEGIVQGLNVAACTEQG